jgi:hypothetical protein
MEYCFPSKAAKSVDLSGASYPSSEAPHVAKQLLLGEHPGRLGGEGELHAFLRRIA